MVSAEITQCLTAYSCSVIAALPGQVLSRQNAYVDLCRAPRRALTHSRTRYTAGSGLTEVGMPDVYLRTVMLMGTVVTIQVVGHGTDQRQAIERKESVERALGWFHRVEACCTRFDVQSEAMRLTSQVGIPVPVSAILYEAVQFALAVAEESGGAFDPTIGCAMETRGFNREYRTNRIIKTALEPGIPASYRDVRLDPERKTITLARPLILDLGAVAKGLAIDMAARELKPFEDYAIDAGGDLFVAGCSPDGAPWSVGIRHPRREDQLIDSLQRFEHGCVHVG